MSKDKYEVSNYWSEKIGWNPPFGCYITGISKTTGNVLFEGEKFGMLSKGVMYPNSDQRHRISLALFL